MRQKHLLKSLLLLLAILAGSSAWAETSTLTFKAQCNGSGTADDNVIWTVTSDGKESNFDNTKGIHYGTGSAEVQYIKLSTSGISGIITKVVVNASTASGVSATADVTVGGSAFGGDAQSLTSSAAEYTFVGSASGEIVVTVTKPSSATKALYVKSIVVTYSTVSASPLASIELSGQYPTTFTEGAEFSHEGMTVTATYEDNSTKDVTSNATFSGYDMAGTGSQTVTVSYTEGEVTKTATYQITVNAIPTHSVTWSVNGETTSDSYKEGASIAFPENPADTEGKTFVGWVTEAIIGTTDEAPTFVNSATMGEADITYYAVFAEKTAGTQATVKDKLTHETAGVTSNQYDDWSGKTVTSNAVYAGNSSKSSINAIQLRSNNSNSGIVTTTSGGTLKSVTVNWTEGNTSGKSLDVYGSNDPYKAPTDLYDSKKQGTKLGSITYNTGTSLTIDGDYAYIGLRSNNGTLYLADITIEWTTGTPDTYSAYCTTVVPDTRKEAGISFGNDAVTVELVDNYTGQTLSNPNSISAITWTSSNEAVATVDESGKVTVIAVGETTITASFAGDNVYKKASASYTLTVQDSRQVLNLSFDQTSVTVNKDEKVAAPTLSGNTGNGTVTYASSNETIATVDPATGEVTGIAEGETTITATVAEVTGYMGGTATFTVTVVDPNAPGKTKENPYTVAQAVEATPTTGEVYIKGIVSSFFSDSPSIVNDGTNYRYYISDNGKDKQLLVFKGKGLNNVAFSNADDLKVGDEVIIYGKLIIYNKAPEIASGNYIVSLNRPEDTTPRINLSATEIVAQATGMEGTITVDYKNMTDIKAAEVQFCDAEGNTAEYDWVVAEINTDKNIDYIIDANTGEARTAYMKVYALYGTEATKIESEIITITQEEFVIDYATLPFNWKGGASAGFTALNGVTASGLGSDYAAANAPYNIKFDSTGDYIQVKTDGQIFNVTLDVKMIGGANESTITVQGSANGEAFTDVEELTISGAQNDVLYLETTNAFNADDRYVRLSFTKGSNVGVGAITINLVKKSISEAGYATYCSTGALDFSNVEGLTAYKATITGTDVKFEKVNKVPAGEGVLLKGAKATYTIPVIATADAITGNALIGVTEETKVSETDIYVLMNEDKGIGFYKTTSAFTLGAHTAYLPALADNTRSFIAIDEATAIKGIAAETKTDGAVYNLQGQRVTKAGKGLYIIGGKKVLVK